MVPEMFGSKLADCFIVSHNPCNWEIVVVEAEVDQGYFIYAEIIECLAAVQKGDAAVTLPIFKNTFVVGKALWAIQLPTVFTGNLRDTTVNAVVIPFK